MKTATMQNMASHKTGRILFGAAALLSFFLSIFLYFTGDKQAGIYVGIWVPSILSAANLILNGGGYG